ncbi:inward rectifying shaker-like K+ channel [Artemisia annua]|uniref:Inward rectifying shaker-like K+ channel n=1 Tax=Artemisia annua TaxID=35608 RepID=A0A2U1Q2E0_ARTAN|nr:inward rectifying shaker-like K+ channel [Artemisia annua]
MEGVLVETENMLARGRMNLPLSLWFATLRGNDQLLQKLLKEGKVVPSLFPPKPICLFPFIIFMCLWYRSKGLTNTPLWWNHRSKGLTNTPLWWNHRLLECDFYCVESVLLQVKGNQQIHHYGGIIGVTVHK